MLMKNEGEMMKKVVMFGIMLLLFISIAYAGFLEYYGKFVGIADIQPPTFIADFYDMSSGWKRLNINNLPQQTGEITINDGGVFVFHTNELNIDSFYPAIWEFHVMAKVNNPPKTLFLELWKVDPEGNLIGDLWLCRVSINVTSSDYLSYTATCPTNETIYFSPSDTLGYVIRGSGGPSVNYSVEVGIDESNNPSTYIRVIPLE